MLQTQTQAPETALISARDLLRCDFVFETLIRGFAKAPGAALHCLWTCISKGDCLEKSVSNTFQIDARSLLYNPRALQKIAEARHKGLKIALIPDIPEAWRRAIALHLRIDEETILSGESIAAAPETAPLCKVATTSVKIITTAQTLISALRIYQWPKNALVFLPILLSHRFNEVQLLIVTLLAFLAFGLAASAIYVVNDLMDVSNDRAHPTKHRRAFASGTIPLRYGLFLASGLLAASIAIASLLSSAFMAVLAGYFLLNLTYTTYLKRKLLIDVLALAGSYTLRILAGNAATGIELSFWLLAFSIFLFFSLALVKRYVEMDTIGVNQPEEKRVMGRGYRYADLDMLSQMGVASAFSAVLVLALYVERAGGTGLYTHPELIWLICPIVMYVICRIWFLAKRGEMKDDPVEFILRDWRSHIMGLIVIAIMIAASW